MVSYKGNDEKKVEKIVLSARPYALDSKLALADQDSWIQSLAQLAQGFEFYGNNTLVVPESTYAEHKKILLKRLQKNPNVIRSEEIRKKIIADLTKEEELSV